MAFAMSAADQSTAVDWSVFYTRLHAFVAARVRQASDTDDLVQLILARALEKGGTTAIDNAPGWLFGIARNAIADHHRTRARTLLREADALDADPPLGSSSDERAAVIACMEPLLAALPGETAQLLRWADMEERSMQRIAESLGITLTAAKSRVQRARKDFIKTTRQCCAIQLDARGRVTSLTPKQNPSAIACEPSTACCDSDRTRK